MTTNSPNPVDGDVQELISEAEAIIELFESAGCLKQVAYRLAKVALASLKAMNNPVGWTDAQELRDVEKDGCGYLFTANPITPNADERRVIMLYTTPPAQLLRPVELPDEAPNALLALCQKVYDSRIKGASVAQDVWQDCLDELFQQTSEVKS